MIRFLLVLLLGNGLVAAGTWYLADAGSISLPGFFIETTILVLFATVLLYAYLDKAGKPDFFTQLYLLSMAIKFLAFGAFMAYVIIDDPVSAKENVVYFLVLYMLSTAIEVGFLYAKITRNNAS